MLEYNDNDIIIDDEIKFNDVIEKIRLFFGDKKQDLIYVIKIYIDFVCKKETEKDKLLRFSKRFNKSYNADPKYLADKTKEFFILIGTSLYNDKNQDNDGTISPKENNTSNDYNSDKLNGLYPEERVYLENIRKLASKIKCQELDIEALEQEQKYQEDLMYIRRVDEKIKKFNEKRTVEHKKSDASFLFIITMIMVPIIIILSIYTICIYLLLSII